MTSNCTVETVPFVFGAAREISSPPSGFVVSVPAELPAAKAEADRTIARWTTLQERNAFAMLKPTTHRRGSRANIPRRPRIHSEARPGLASMEAKYSRSCSILWILVSTRRIVDGKFGLWAVGLRD